MLRRIACVGLLVTLGGCRDTVLLHDGMDAAVEPIIVVPDAGSPPDEKVPWQDPGCSEIWKTPRFSPQLHEIIIALDRSSSMQASFPGSSSRQSAVQTALNESIGTYQSRVRFGIALFPGDANGGSGGCYHNSCCAGQPSWPSINAQNYISGYLLCSEQQGCLTDSSDSPSHKALDQIRDFIEYRFDRGWIDPGMQSVLLITASEPSCGGENGNGDPCPAKTAAAQLANLDIPIVIVTVGYDPRTKQDSCLVQLSKIGAPGPDRLNTPSSASALKDTLASLFKAAAKKSCTFTTYEVIPDFATPTVTLNSSTIIPKDGPEGWSFDGPDRSRIKLSDKACDQFADSPTATITVSYTCSTCDGPNACPPSRN